MHRRSCSGCRLTCRETARVWASTLVIPPRTGCICCRGHAWHADVHDNVRGYVWPLGDPGMVSARDEPRDLKRDLGGRHWANPQYGVQRAGVRKSQVAISAG